MHFDAKKENLSQIILYVLGKAQEHGLHLSKCKKLELALEELLVNIISYAYEQGEGLIFVDVKGGDPFCVVIKDQGRPFDPTVYRTLPVEDLPLEEREVGGLGLYLVQKMIDEMSYRRENGFNVLTLQMYNSK